MGFFSQLKELADTLETGVRENMSTVPDYGEPVSFLYTALNLGDLHRRIDVTDDQDVVRYYTKSSVFALKGATDLLDASNNLVAHLEKKVVSLHEKQFITMANGTNITLSNELFHLVKDITNIEGLGWKIEGDIVGLDFNLLDANGEPIAAVRKKMVSIHDKYCIGLFKPEYEPVVVAIVIALEKMIEARRENQSSTTFSFGD